MLKRTELLAALILGVAGAGCQSGWVMVAPTPPENYEVLGSAEGSASGALLIDGTAYNFIPAGLNSRVDRAYQDAVDSVAGATGLINVTLKDSWYWFVVGSMRVTTITGDAIRAGGAQ